MKIRLMAISILIFFYSCVDYKKDEIYTRPNDSIEPKRYTGKNVKYLFSIGNDSAVVFYNVSSIDINNNNKTLLILDRGGYKLHIFNLEGNLLKSIGNKGKGPGEFMSPVFCSNTTDYIIVTEQFIPVAHLFDKDYQYVKDIILPLHPIEIDSYDEQVIIFGTEANTNKLKIGRFSIKTLKIEEAQIPLQMPYKIEFEKKDELIELIWKSVNLAILGNKLFLAYNYQNKLMCYDNGAISWEKTFDFLPNYSKQIKSGDILLPEEKLIQDIDYDNKGNIYVLFGENSKYPNRLIKVFDSKGNELKEIILDYESKSIKIFNSHKIFCLDKNKIFIHCFNLL